VIEAIYAAITVDLSRNQVLPQKIESVWRA